MDLSKLSDAELEAMLGEGAKPAPAGPVVADLSSMSDEELARIAGPWEQYQGETSEAAPPWAQFADEQGSGQAATSLAGAYGRVMGLGARTGWSAGLQGLAAPASLAADAGINLAYGAKKLASKTGLVEAPDPANYYKSDSYLPVTSGIAGAVDAGMDAVGLPKPESATERVVSAGAGGVVSALTGAGAGKVIATGGSALAKSVGGFLAAQPEVQAAAGAASGVSAQGATELGATPTGAMAAGFLAGGATGLAGAKARQPGRAPIPTTEDLRAAKTAAYGQADAAGLEFTPQAVAGLDNSVRRSLPGEGIFLDMDAKARSVVEPLSRSHAPDAAGNRAPVSLGRMDAIRQQAGKLGNSLDANERRTGTVLAGHVDDFLDNVTPGQVAAGNAADGIGALREGQAANRRFAKASALDTALDKAELRAASTGTGSNGENTVRQNLRQIIQDPKSRAFRQFDPPEREAMRSIVEGSRTQNALRWGSKFAPTGGVSGNLGFLAASQGYGLLPLAGYAAKGAADYLHGRKVRSLEALVKGGPGAGRRPSARYGANTARGAAQGFLAGPGADALYR